MAEFSLDVNGIKKDVEESLNEEKEKYENSNIKQQADDNAVAIFDADLNDPKERENIVAKQYGAVFIMGIGGKMADGSIHDGRAPDYDDWISEAGDGHHGLNGDLLVWNPILEQAFELSSMGIRVSPESLKAQLEERGCPERANLFFHKRLLNGELTPSIGGGIGQSRLCMYFLRKAHIGETQVSIWPQEMVETCKANGIHLL